MNSKCLMATCLIGLVTGCIVASSGCIREAVDQRERSFANAVADIVGIEIPLNEELELVPANPQFYAPDGLVSFFVYNHTGHNLIFADDIFGARGFVFNSEEAKWSEVDLGNFPMVPKPRRLRNGTTKHDETIASFFADQLEGYGEIRLLVVGYAEDTPIAEVYGAYADIKIVKGSNPNVTIITPSPTQ